MPNYDLTNLALQIAAPNNVLLYDDVGDPSVMVRIPKFKISDVIPGGPDSTHPAFIVNGVERDSIFISKYLNVVNNGRAYSLPMQDPHHSVNFDNAGIFCRNKGPGWHLMTQAEYAAVAPWCKKNGFMPRGNNNWGKDILELSLPQKALPTSFESDGRIARTATGSGPVSWYHDNTEAGIADLNGNVWEWGAGLRLMDGEIQILRNNDAADWNNPVTAASSLWQAIMPDGTLVAPNTAGTLKYTQTSVGFHAVTTTPAATGAGAALLQALGLIPEPDMTAADYETDHFWATLTGERVPIRGGGWHHAAQAGVFALTLNHARSYVGTHLGFRAAFVSL
ncbi:MAG: formylglycine-generating enzyme family protein [Oscillospiraceae bacterium]|jgi:hypothetical protein|nr:formylglycine-generating enzyme family protein [Oscillospiraceae bacterium]